MHLERILSVRIRKEYLVFGVCQTVVIMVVIEFYFKLSNKKFFFILGYLSIFLFALDIGHYILPLDPYYTLRPNRQTKKPKPKKLVMILFSWSILFWLGFLIVTLCNIKVSRQMANLSYVFWVASFNITYLSLFQSVELYYFKNYWKSYEKTVPNLAEAINSNGLLIFLVVSNIYYIIIIFFL